MIFRKHYFVDYSSLDFSTMRHVLHILATLVVFPYAVLAVGFLFVGKVASSRGPLSLLQSLFDIFVLIVPWGAIGFLLAFLCVACLTFFQVKGQVPASALAGISGLSLVIVMFYRPSLPSIGEVLFMLPCFVVLVGSGWQLLSGSK